MDVDQLIEKRQKDAYIQRLLSIAPGTGGVTGVTKNDTDDANDVRKIAGIVVKDVVTQARELRPKEVVPASLQRL